MTSSTYGTLSGNPEQAAPEKPPDLTEGPPAAYPNGANRHGRSQEGLENLEERKGSWVRQHPTSGLEGRRLGLGQGPPIPREQDVECGRHPSRLEAGSPG